MKLEHFFKETVIYAMGVLGSRATIFLLIPLYTHSLSTSDYGALSILLLITQTMAVFVDLGNRKSFVRFATEYADKNLLGSLLGTTTLLILVTGLIVITCSNLFLPSLFQRVLYINDAAQYVPLTCYAALAQALNTHVMSYYRVTQDGSKYALLSAGICGLACVTNYVLLLIFHQGLKGALMAQILTYGGSWFIIICSVYSRVKFNFSPTLVPKLLRFGTPLVVITASALITDTVAMSLLGHSATLDQVAIFSLGYKVSQIVSIVLILPFQLAYEPFIYAHMNTSGIQWIVARLLTYLVLAFAFAALGLALISRGLLNVIAPPAYFSALGVIPLMLPGLLFSGIYNIGESLLHTKNKTHITSTIVLISVLLSCSLNFFLIPYCGIYGAIFTHNLINIILATVVLYFGIKLFPIPLEFKRLATVGGLLVFFLVIAFVLKDETFIIYYGTITFATVLGITCVYFSRVWDADDKAMLSKVWNQSLRVLSLLYRDRTEPV